ncbi:DHA2 family metal-tetracycline-proton antiporter-like MFS transporter [Methanomicrobium sp. W14]|uniref:DHA2 family efflux MFS transporter permease subunit n=1 Tax=Methanomicrobium sp. W14 TaxID=2817839 RepID=UPI001AE96FE4|nr:DHA2 family efflux MFS transporter permease subunit [Methanomicrobium sp. W14]MBP2133874.1 DHA2 family metal-tetracycline-proton antiporter-like MFS transporter [Methanomicrobium sp. W14]
MKISGRTGKSPALILLVVGTGLFMDGLDGAIVNISLPQIAEGFSSGLGMASLVLTIYLAALSSLMIIFAKSLYFLGTKKVYISGLALFTVSSFLCTLSWDIESLILFRALQGAGAAMIAPSAIAAVAIHVGESKRARSFGIIAAVASLAYTIGPVVGGLLTEYLNWHWIFLINIPIGTAGILLAAYLLPADKTEIFDRQKFDYTGSCLFFVAMNLFILPLGFLGSSQAGLLKPVFLTALSAILFIIFAFAETKALDPVIDFSMFKNRDFSYSTVAYTLVMLIYGGLFLILPFYLEDILGKSTGQAGLYLLIPSFLITVLSPVSGYFADKKGERIISVISSVVFTASFAIILLTFSQNSIFWLIFALIITGIGCGSFLSAGSSRIIEHSAEDKKEMASGIMSTSIYLGTALGTSLFAAIFEFFSGGVAQSATVTSNATFMKGFNAAVFAGLLFCIIIVLTSYMAKDKKSATN